MNGDLEVGATGTVTEVDGNRVYAFGHPFFGLGPTQFPMTRAHVITVLPSLASSMKIASTGDVIGIVQQDRATTIAGTLGPGPSMIPISLTLNSERGHAEEVLDRHRQGSALHATAGVRGDPEYADVIRAAERRRNVHAARRRSREEPQRRRLRGPVHRRSALDLRRRVGRRAAQRPAAECLRGRRVRGAEPGDRRQRAATQRHARARLDRRHEGQGRVDSRSAHPAPHLSRRRGHTCDSGSDPGERAWKRLDHGCRRRAVCRSSKRASFRCSHCRRPACRR